MGAFYFFLSVPPSISKILDEFMLMSGESQSIQRKTPRVKLTSTETLHGRLWRLCTQSNPAHNNNWSVEITSMSCFSWTNTCKWLDFQRFLELRAIDCTPCLAKSQRSDMPASFSRQRVARCWTSNTIEYVFMSVACTVFGNDFFEACCVGKCYFIAQEVDGDFSDMGVINCNKWKATERSGYKRYER